MLKTPHLLNWYRTMIVIRYFEEKVEDLFSQGLITGTSHPCIGQEAIAVGTCSALRKKDYVTSNHRGHGHFIAHGGNPSMMMAELFGKGTGYSEGRGGSQLMADYSMGFIGGNGITGGSIPIATGIALSIKLKKTARVAICFFGDGASNQGTFHESLNMAGLWNLPVVFICENNMYAMSNHVSNSTNVQDIAIRAKSYGIKGEIVDGNDLLAVQAAVSNACSQARSLNGPTLIECKTYRLSGHSRGDQRIYRTREEEHVARQNDPIKRFRKTLKKEYGLTTEINNRIKQEARQIISNAVKFARTSKFPDHAAIKKAVFT